MATYVYETTDPKAPVRRFEIQQSMKDEPLTTHPETGEPVRRVITGGYLSISSATSSTASSGSCGTGCGCH